MDREPNHAFTLAFHRPSAFAGTVNFVARNSQFAIGRVDNDAGALQKVILIRYEVDWFRIWTAVFVVGLLLGVGIGVLVEC